MIRLSKSIVGQLEAAAAAKVIVEDGYLGMGQAVQRFELELQEYLGVKHVMCVNSGTAALHLAVQALGLGIGDEVLVQSLTFVSDFQAISATGAKPIACEIIPQNGTIDLADTAKRLSTRTKAIMPVHYASNPGDLDAIYAFAKENNLRVIEDAAHAFGCYYKGKKIGSFGDIACFSFDGIKNITSGEGGAVATNDDQIAELVKNARLLGVEKDTEKRFSGERSWESDVRHQGYRYHMSNILAAIGSVQLSRFENEFRPKRIALAKQYRERLKSVEQIQLLQGEPGDIVPHIFSVRVLNGQRDALRQYLTEQEIQTGIHYLPNHLLTYYGAKKGTLPITEQFYREIISLPLHPGLTACEMNNVLQAINKFFDLNT